MSGEEQEKTTIEVGGVEYTIAKTGKAQAEQIAEFSGWLSKYAVPVFSSMSENSKEEDVGTQNYLIALLSNLSADALIELFIVVIGCSKKVADEYFDLALLIDAALIFWDKQTGIKRLVNRFFSTPT